MDSYLGQIILGAWNYAPVGWLPCNGETLQVSSNVALFALLGTAFGGDGRTTFMLPNLTAPVASNATNNSQPNPGYYICVSDGIWPTRP